MDKTVLKAKQLVELREIAGALQLKGYKSLKKADLIDLIAAGGPSNGGGAASKSQDVVEAKPAPKATQGRFADERETPSTNADRIRARRRGAPVQGADVMPETAKDVETDKPSSDGVNAESRDRVRTREERGERDRPERDRPERPRAERDRPERDRPERQERDRTDRPATDSASADADDSDVDGDGRNRNRNRSRNRKGRGNDGINFDELEVRQGVLDLLPEGYGFLRTTGYLAGDHDVYVSQAFVRRNQLRRGDVLAGPVRYNKGNDKFPALARVDSIEGDAVEEDVRPAPRDEFATLTAVFPSERFALADDKDASPAVRLLDLLAPIGKGQRGLVIAPPRGGTTSLLKALAGAVEKHNPNAHVMVLLIDERPEEVTDFQAAIEGEVIASTFERSSEDHTQIAELTIERAKRIVERGRDVVVILDSLSKLVRSHNAIVAAPGRALPSGLDVTAVQPVKRFFAMARDTVEGGSLTIIAAAANSGSAIDDAILDAFSGTATMELHLLAQGRDDGGLPAIDVHATGTRREDLLLSDAEVKAMVKLRKELAELDQAAARDLLAKKLGVKLS
ncbi:MAG: transcription termination factor Rho [Glaciecola sp.]|jgi:transcription termination factor Rho